MNENEKVFFDTDDDWADIDFSDLVDDAKEETNHEDTAAEEVKEDTEGTPEANPAEDATPDGAGEPAPAPQMDVRVLHGRVGVERRVK